MEEQSHSPRHVLRMKTRIFLLLLLCNVSLFMSADYFEYNGLSYSTYWGEGSDEANAVAYCQGLAADNPDPESIVVPNSVVYHYSVWVNNTEIHKTKVLRVKTASISGGEHTKSIIVSDDIDGANGISGPSLESVYLGCTAFSTAFNSCPNLTHITVGPNYKRHNNQTTCFYGTTNLKEITWNAISAEQGRFDGGMTITAGVLQNLETLTFGNQVQYIPPEIANNAVKLNHVTIPSSVTAIGRSAFVNSGLTEIFIPNSVVSIDYSAFSGCGNLTSVVMENSVTSLGNGVFTSCSNLRNVKLSNSLTSIPSSTFSNCTSLNKIVIPKKVNVIGGSAFRACDSLKHVYLPDSLKTVENHAFNQDYQLAHVYSPIKEPQNVSFLTSNPFINSSCIVHVPKGTLALYQALSPWNKYVLIDDYEHYVYAEGDVNCDGNVTSYDVTAIYNYLLNNDQTYINTLDVNDDGVVTAADITAIYSIMLGN